MTKKTEASAFLISVEIFLNRSASFDCFFKTASCSSYVLITSSTRRRLFVAAFKRSSESCLRDCKPKIPAASSRTIFLSSGFACVIAPILPWLTIEVDLAEVDASAKSNWISFNLTSLPLIYELVPSPLQILRAISKDLDSNLFSKSEPSIFTKSPTSAKFHEGLLSVPLKMRSSISLPRNCFADTSPSPNRIASTIFDFPQPFGPTIPVRPVLISNSVGSTKDLKPLIDNLSRDNKLFIF